MADSILAQDMLFVESRPPMIAAPLLAAENVRHGFFTRKGGVSTGIYASLNVGLGSSDDRAHVIENRARAAERLGVRAGRLVTPYQVHSADVVAVEAPWGSSGPARADALVTNVPGLAIGVSTADCGPILFAAPASGVVGAAHAGWRGALGGVIEATIAAMEGLGARREDIRAALGPTISAESYEVGPDLRDRFVASEAANAAFFRPAPRAGHFLFDLPGYILARLERAGVRTENLGLCTYGDERRFYSYRRTTHRGEADYGRLLSAIVLA